ncbi:MAG: MoxR family ATPase [Spirochaetaceae bacterium]|nr:MAG: MoxR family ATPase [Spirochaetaceae bacterium]
MNHAITDAVDRLTRAREEISSRIVGHGELIDELFVCLLCRGHALIEGAPGLGKTYLIKTFGNVLALTTTRIQFTPDLMPADIVGTNVLIRDETGDQVIRFQKGPLFSRIVLADEINRATPKTQSAMLEAMQEQAITYAGTTYPLSHPFIVLATQNPIEMEGTYPLPEAQLDRFFFKISVGYPSADELLAIVDRTTGPAPSAVGHVLDGAQIVAFQELVRAIVVARPIAEYAVRLVTATHPGLPGALEVVRRAVRYGSSPRGAQGLVLAAKAFALMDGREHAGFEDIRRAALPVLRHRLIPSFQGEAEGVDPDTIVSAVVDAVAEVE